MSREAEVRAIVLGRVADQLTAVGLDATTVPDDFDLFFEGALDSLGLLELLAALQDRFGCEVDLEDLPADDLGVVGPFCRFIAAAVERQSGSLSVN